MSIGEKDPALSLLSSGPHSTNTVSSLEAEAVVPDPEAEAEVPDVDEEEEGEEEEEGGDELLADESIVPQEISKLLMSCELKFVCIGWGRRGS